MKQLIQLTFLLIVLAVMALPAQAQWQCAYATYDDDVNGTGHNTPSVAVISEDTFIALVMSPDVRNFMIPYVDADSAVGRVYTYGYGGETADVYELWSDQSFDQVLMKNAAKIVATSDGTIYVANNDDNHNILVFKFASDTIDSFSPYYREATGSNSIFGIAVDENGYVYVCNDTTSGPTDDIKIYPPIAQWTTGRNDAPAQTVDLPDGHYLGITTTPDGSAIFVCDSTNRKILKYVGSPASGYAADPSFDFQLSPDDTSTTGTVLPVPINLAYMPANNILFAAVDVHGYTSGTRSYEYGRIYLINPFTGDLADADSSISVIDVAQWNYDLTGSYSNRAGGTDPGNASGYTSTYDVALDANGNLYSQSHFGWTVEKWVYSGTLPVITSVQQVSPEAPEGYHLFQNYPNPFNPVTNITYAVPARGFVELRVYDLLGRLVTTLVSADQAAGTYTVRYDASSLSSGTYVYTIHSGDFTATRTFTLIK